jgi:hypothetical protein
VGEGTAMHAMAEALLGYPALSTACRGRNELADREGSLGACVSRPGDQDAAQAFAEEKLGGARAGGFCASNRQEP